MDGTVFNIQRFCDSDGPGIRTAVFFKGCPLSCKWCHNPESQSPRLQIAYSEKKCISCGICASVCKSGCHKIINGEHVFDRQNCIACMKCVDACPSALTRTGCKITSDKLTDIIAEDEDFYKTSGGGVTFSGGEVYLQHGFLLEVLKKCKARHFHTCIETSGFTEWKNIEKTLPYTDMFLYDWKISDTALHKQYTGVGNETILDNLKRLSECGVQTVLRCPVICGVNDNEAHFARIAELAETLDNITHIEILPYHDTYSQKAHDNGLSVQRFSVSDSAEKWINIISKNTRKEVRRG